MWTLRWVTMLNKALSRQHPLVYISCAMKFWLVKYWQKNSSSDSHFTWIMHWFTPHTEPKSMTMHVHFYILLNTHRKESSGSTKRCNNWTYSRSADTEWQMRYRMLPLVYGLYRLSNMKRSIFKVEMDTNYFISFWLSYAELIQMCEGLNIP